MLGSQQLFFILLGVCALFTIGLAGWVFYLHMQLGKVTEHYDRLLKNVDIPSLQGALDYHLERIEKCIKAVNIISENQQVLAENMSNVIQKVGLLKYNEHSSTGGNQSFLLALLDARDNGVLLNSIHSRAGTRVYAKELHQGVAEHPLTQEEQSVLSLAQKR